MLELTVDGIVQENVKVPLVPAGIGLVKDPEGIVENRDVDADRLLEIVVRVLPYNADPVQTVEPNIEPDIDVN